MNTQVKADSFMDDAIECGAIDSGMAGEGVVRKTVSSAPKTRTIDEDDAPMGDINCYGVGVIKMDD